MHVDARHDTVLRTMSVAEDDAISDGWLCDRGRYNIGFSTTTRRLTTPLLQVDGETWVQIAWDDAIALWASRSRSNRAGGPNASARSAAAGC